MIPAADTGCHLYTNVAIAFPRSPMHLAYTAWDLAELSDGRFSLASAPRSRRTSSGATGRRGPARWVECASGSRQFAFIGRTWQNGEPLGYVGEHTSHTLMTPAFEPGPLPSGLPPIWLGALGPAMTRLATAVADGMLVHPFTSDRHLANVTLPRIQAGLEAAGGPGPTSPWWGRPSWRAPPTPSPRPMRTPQPVG